MFGEQYAHKLREALTHLTDRIGIRDRFAFQVACVEQAFEQIYCFLSARFVNLPSWNS